MGHLLDDAKPMIDSCQLPFANGMSDEEILRLAHRQRPTSGPPPERVRPRPNWSVAAPRRRGSLRAGGRPTSRWSVSCRRRRSQRSCAPARSASTAGTRASRDDARLTPRLSMFPHTSVVGAGHGSGASAALESKAKTPSTTPAHGLVASTLRLGEEGRSSGQKLLWQRLCHSHSGGQQ